MASCNSHTSLAMASCNSRTSVREPGQSFEGRAGLGPHVAARTVIEPLALIELPEHPVGRQAHVKDPGVLRVCRVRSVNSVVEPHLVARAVLLRLVSRVG